MRIRLLALALGVMFLGACNDATRPDLNDPSASDYSNITSLGQIQTLAAGILVYDRGAIGTEVLRNEIIGRDAYNLPVSEPRWVTELLGPQIDPGGFNGTATWPYASVREANIGIDGVQAAATSVMTDEQKNSTIGFLRTWKALSLLRAIETRDTAGAPTLVDIDPTGPLAPLNCKGDVLAYIAAQLDSGYAELQNGGSAFPFNFPTGFEGFDDPAGFAQFNRALAAKTDIYLAFRDYASPDGTIPGTIDASWLTAAQSALDASFLNVAANDTAALDVGPEFDYSTASGDATNGLYGDPASTTLRANPRVAAEAVANDRRVAEKTVTTTLETLAGVSSDLGFIVYPTPTSPSPIITNKELIAMQAEVYWGQGNLTQALATSNILRTVDGGLAASTASGSAAILNEILYEKRYSLLFISGDRWVDARLFGKLNGQDPPDGIGMENGNPPLWSQPIPQPEANARNGDLSKAACTVT